MISIEYRPVRGRIMPTYGVWVSLPDPQPPMLAGYVSLGHESWFARERGDSPRIVGGWHRRSDAAAWLLITEKMAYQRHEAA